MNFIYGNKASLIEKFSTTYKTIHPTRNLLKGSQQRLEQLRTEWYEHLRADDMDAAYNIYSYDDYLVDTLDCYINYSREYIKRIHKSLVAYELVRDCSSVIDVGCGIGYSTVALTQLLPNAKVYATNIKNTKQWAFCEELAAEYNFTLLENVYQAEKHIDVVFASEYFEHMSNPAAEFKAIVTRLTPKIVVVASSFNTQSIGHFVKYQHEGIAVPETQISRLFNTFVSNCGYERVPCSFWNNKPLLWQRTSNDD